MSFSFPAILEAAYRTVLALRAASGSVHQVFGRGCTVAKGVDRRSGEVARRSEEKWATR